MRRGSWFHFWRGESNALELLRRTTRAAATGEAIEKLTERSAHGLLEAGNAQCAGVWLESSDDPQVFDGVVVDAGSDQVPQQWRRLELSSPLLGLLMEASNPVVTELRELPWAWMIGPLAEMRTAVWIPLRFRERTLGVAMVAYGAAGRPRDIDFLRTLAEAFMVAAAQQRELQLLERSEEERSGQVNLQRALLEGAPADQILRQVAAQAVRYTNAKFVAIGEIGGEQPRFMILEGPLEAASLAHDAVISATWRTALKERRVAVTDVRPGAGTRPAGERAGSAEF
jgi:GAF domain-containing protein